MASTKTSRKENIKPSGSIKSYFKTSKNVRSGIPVSTSSKKAPSAGQKKTKARPAPDFSKLHQKWQKKLECGKAVSKKASTVSQEFDLTRPGTNFTHVPRRELSFSECEPAEDNPLTSLCDVEMDAGVDRESESQLEIEPPKGVKRRVLGDLTAADLNSPNKSPKTSSKQRSKSTADLQSFSSREQSDLGVVFEEDPQALASILSNQGIEQPVVPAQSQGRAPHPTTRLTELPGQMPRNSLFSQRAPRYSMRELREASPLIFGLEPVRVRGSIYMTYKSLTKYRTPLKEEPKTPLRPAVRVPVTTQSPATFSTPSSCPRRNVTGSKVKSQAVRVPVTTQSPATFTTPSSCARRNVTGSQVNSLSARKKFRWADVLASPVHPREAVQCNDQRAEEGIPTDVQDTEAISRVTQPSVENISSPAVIKDFPVQETCRSNQTPCNNNNASSLVSEVGSDVNLSNCETIAEKTGSEKPNMVADAVVPEVKKFISKTLKHRRQSVDELSQSLSESQTYLGKLNSKAKKLSGLQNGENIVDELSRIKKLQEELAAVEASLKNRLVSEENICAVSSDENKPPLNTVRPYVATKSNSGNNVLREEQRSNISESLNADEHQNGEGNELLPLDLTVKTNKTRDNNNKHEHTSDDISPRGMAFESPDNVAVQLTPFITKKVGDLRLTETTGLSGVSKETLEQQLASSDSAETKSLDDQRGFTTSKNTVSLTKSCPSDLMAPHTNACVLKIVSPVAEKKNVPSTCSSSDAGVEDFLAPPIWTPLALRSAGAVNLLQPRLESGEGSHAVSMVVKPGRCQAADDSHRPLCLGSQPQSASCINQSADSEDGSGGNGASRHLGLSGCKGMTHTSSPCCCYHLPNSPPQKSAAIPPVPPPNHYHTSAAHVVHKCRQGTPARHTHEDSAKDGHTDAAAARHNNNNDSTFGFDSSHATPPQSTPASRDHCHPFVSQDFVRSHFHSGNTSSQKSAKLPQGGEAFQGHPQTFQGHGCFQSRTAERPRPSDNSKSETTNPASLTARERHLSPRSQGNSVPRRRVSPPHGEVGSLSLTGNLWQRPRPAAVVSPTTQVQRRIAGRLQSSQQMYLDSLLDEECALFTCCRRPEPAEDTRCPNPIARLLSEGDSMHFLPISDDYHRDCGHLEGSAFGTYTPVHTRSMERTN